MVYDINMLFFSASKTFFSDEYPTTTNTPEYPTATITPGPFGLVPTYFDKNVPIVLPLNVIQGSVHITVSITGKMFY